MITKNDYDALFNRNRWMITTPQIASGAILVASTFHYNVIVSNPANNPYEILIDDIRLNAPSSTNTPMPTASKFVTNPTALTSPTPAAAMLMNIGATGADLVVANSTYNTNAMGVPSGQLSGPFQVPTANDGKLLTTAFTILPGFSVGFDFSVSMLVGAGNSSPYLMIYYIRKPL